MSDDLNIENYTVPELLTILDLDENATENDINEATNKYIDKFNKTGNTDMVNFFQEMQTTLVSYVQNEDNKQTDEWYKNEALEQDDNTQKDKVTDRRQKVDVYDNNHLPMKRQQLGINNNFQVPVSQDTLNPNLKNVTTRLINLDSQFRQATGGIDTLSTDYTLDLSDPLIDVLSMRLYSIQIPFTWYVIDTMYGNTCFWIIIPYNTINNIIYEIKVSFTPGNYTYTSFQTEFIAAISAAGITNPGTGAVPLININPNNAKVTINLDGWQYLDTDTGDIIPITGITEYANPLVPFDPAINPYFLFFDFNGRLNCLTNGIGCVSQNLAFNGTFGWLMGFRLPIVPIFKSPGTTGTAIVELNGPKYFIIVLVSLNVVPL